MWFSNPSGNIAPMFYPLFYTLFAIKTYDHRQTLGLYPGAVPRMGRSSCCTCPFWVLLLSFSVILFIVRGATNKAVKKINE